MTSTAVYVTFAMNDRRWVSSRSCSGAGCCLRPTEGLADVLAREKADGVYRVRSDGGEPARRFAAADDEPGAAAARGSHARLRSSAAAPGSSAIRAARARSASLLDARAGGGKCAWDQDVNSSAFWTSIGGRNAARMANNVDWLRPIGFLEFLRDVGKHFTVNYMTGEGIGEAAARRATRASRSPSSATSCCRPTTTWCCTIAIGCTLQMGGSDQWGNIVGGLRSDSQGARRARARPRAAAGDDVGRHEVRQDRGGHGVARCRS